MLAAAQRLLQFWLADACNGDVLKLLEALDVQAYPGMLLCVLSTLKYGANVDFRFTRVIQSDNRPAG